LAPGRRDGERAPGLRGRPSGQNRAGGSRRMNRVDTMNRGIDHVRAIDQLDIPPMRDKVSEEEWKIRVDLAAAYRLVAYYGWGALVFTHPCARGPGAGRH